MSPNPLDLTYSKQVKALRTRLLTFTEARFREGQFRDADADRFVATMRPMLGAGQRTVASLTDAWLAHRLTQQLGRPIRPGVATEKVTGRAVRDVDPDVMWRRPYLKTRTGLAQGKNLELAATAGARLAVTLMATNLQLARTHTVREVLTRTDGVLGYQRTTTGPTTCARCYLASTQAYKRGDLMPIHDFCDCSVEPIVGEGKLPHVVKPDVLSGTHEAIEERFGAFDLSGRANIDYRNVVLVEQHGEYGPVLTVASHHFSGVA